MGVGVGVGVGVNDGVGVAEGVARGVGAAMGGDHPDASDEYALIESGMLTIRMTAETPITHQALRTLLA